jgi:hypothetical protein
MKEKAGERYSEPKAVIDNQNTISDCYQSRLSRADQEDISSLMYRTDVQPEDAIE